jgi:SAM-dependent methyltransferase
MLWSNFSGVFSRHEDAPDTGPVASPEALRHYYDQRYAGFYMTEHPRASIGRLRDVLSTIPAAEITSVLDYGCGRGSWIPLLRAQFPSAPIAGIDISEIAVEAAAAKFPWATFAAFDGKRAPHPDAAFTLVFSYHVLEHVLDLRQTLDDISRLVQPGGWACLILPCGNEGSFEYVIAERTNAFEVSSTGEVRFRFEDDAHLRRLRSALLLTLLGERGLEPVGVHFANHFWGAIEFIGRSEPAFINRLVDIRHARRPRDVPALVAIRASLLTLSQVNRLYRVATFGTTSRSARRARIAKLLRPAGMLAAPIARSVSRLASAEWQTRRSDPGGSAQYLVLRRGAS